MKLSPILFTLAAAKEKRPGGDVRPRTFNCGADLSATEGTVTITSPNYPDAYNDFENCQWTFFTSECVTGYTIDAYEFEVEGNQNKTILKHYLCSRMWCLLVRLLELGNIRNGQRRILFRSQ